jgi:hypothetical protein
MFTRRGSLARINAAIVLIVLAGCAPGKSPSSAAPLWKLESEMRGNTKVCQLTQTRTSRSLMILLQPTPKVPELGDVVFYFRAPELNAAAMKRWAVDLQYDTGGRTGFLSAVDENVVSIQPNTMMLKDIFDPMETATTLDVRVLYSGAVVHFDLAGLPEALPSLRACAAEGAAL